MSGWERGSLHDLESRIKTHVFVLCPNNSGSTILARALADCRRAWHLTREGQLTFGFVGPPEPPVDFRRTWASCPDWLTGLQNRSNYAWEATRKAWYFQALSRTAEADVLVEKSPAFLFIPDLLRESFRNSRFVLMVRDPYATAEGIMRTGLELGRRRSLSRTARHVVSVLAQQARNRRELQGISVCFTYEQLCAQPENVEQAIGRLVPALSDVSLRSTRPRGTDRYDPVVDRNRLQIERLSCDDLSALNEVFSEHADVLGEFGYSLRE